MGSMKGTVGSYAELRSGSGILEFRVRTFVLFLIYAALTLENVLQTQVTEACSYIDEVASILLAIWAVAIRLKTNAKSSVLEMAKRPAMAIIPICIIGLLSNYVSGAQQNFPAILADAFTCSKFFIALVSISVIVSDGSDLLSLCTVFAKFLTIIFLVFAIIEQFFSIGMSEEVRYGLHSFLFLYGHPSNFAATVVCISALFMVRYKENTPYLLMCVALLCWSGRSKAIGIALVILVMILLYRKNVRFSVSFILLCTIGAIIVAIGQIEIYFGNEETARSALLRGSFTVANSMFPLGSGFGTYGSNISAEYYPTLYYELGFNRIYGLTPDNPAFLIDSFWPIVIGQFGWAGLFIMVYIVYSLIKGSLGAARQTGCNDWAAVLIPLYLVIASTSETALFSTYGPQLAFTLILVISQARTYCSERVVS